MDHPGVARGARPGTMMANAVPRFCIVATLSLVACAPPSTTGGSAPSTATSDSAAFTIAGDPRQPEGAPWSLRQSVDGVRYELTGVILVPDGPGPFPAVVLSHGSAGSARTIASEVGR